MEAAMFTISSVILKEKLMSTITLSILPRHARGTSTMLISNHRVIPKHLSFTHIDKLTLAKTACHKTLMFVAIVSVLLVILL